MADQSCRIPLSIKVDRDEMYKNFIAPARSENRLNTLVVELLRAYYEVDSVRECIDQRMLKTDELKAMQLQIDKMLAEHVQTIAQTKALEFETAQAANGVTLENKIRFNTNEDMNGSMSSEDTKALQLRTAISEDVTVDLVTAVNNISQRLNALENQIGGTTVTKSFENAPKTASTSNPVNGDGGGATASKTVNFGASSTVFENIPSIHIDDIDSGLLSAQADTPPIKKRKKPTSFGKICASLEKIE